MIFYLTKKKIAILKKDNGIMQVIHKIREIANDTSGATRFEISRTCEEVNDLIISIYRMLAGMKRV